MSRSAFGTHGILPESKYMRGMYGRTVRLMVAGLLMLGGVVAPFITSVAYAANGEYTWTTHGISASWSTVASSADGTKLAAVNLDDGYVYTSTDSGATWIKRTSEGSKYWNSIALSADGTKLAIGDLDNGYIYTSSDSGATWTQRTSAGVHQWAAVTSSADGTKLAAAADFGPGGYIYTSSDSGATWTEQTAAGKHAWAYVTSNADGTKLAAIRDGYIYTSSDSGATWTERTSAGSRLWFSIALSADGTKLIASESDMGGYIYTSSDSGATWTQQGSMQGDFWGYVASSADGTKLAASASQAGYIYTSSDSGATWTEQTAAGISYWAGLAFNADGTKLAATSEGPDAMGGYIYLGTTTFVTTPAFTLHANGQVIGEGSTIAVHPTFSGTAQPNAQVEVTVRSDPIVCTTIADGDGNWSCTLSSDIPVGTHTVTVVVTDPDTEEATTHGPYTVHVTGTEATTIGAPDTGLGFASMAVKIWSGVALISAGVMITLWQNRAVRVMASRRILPRR